MSKLIELGEIPKEPGIVIAVALAREWGLTPEQIDKLPHCLGSGTPQLANTLFKAYYKQVADEGDAGGFIGNMQTAKCWCRLLAAYN